MKDGLVHEIHFAYDHNPNLMKISWPKEKLVSLIEQNLSTSFIDNFIYSDEATVENIGSTHVDHPIFGYVLRRGWAVFKSRNSYKKAYSIKNI
jgi:hypothetical protein